ncbi:inorganic diphosphatase [Ferruginibacter albus]|uniref:inorganic diphosphatase n=1 Tax=Ferruginibacter albus TaxID=2875540 RepID=UPI001CC5345F|nr:inorganic diphosphatase [Ferruginibacter albus]UAY51090.1 inorganic diphosphatase [Ferruginibacter albus]
MKNYDIIIETPKEGHFKYKFEPSAGMFKLNKILPQGLVFPYDFGFVPYTVGEDGDPLDVLVFSEHALFTGCVVECRIIGGIQASEMDENKISIRNDRLIGIPVLSKVYAHINSIDQIEEEKINEIKNFFISYNSYYDKTFITEGVLSAADVEKLIKQSNNSYHHFKNKPTLSRL